MDGTAGDRITRAELDARFREHRARLSAHDSDIRALREWLATIESNQREDARELRDEMRAMRRSLDDGLTVLRDQQKQGLSAVDDGNRRGTVQLITALATFAAPIVLAFIYLLLGGPLPQSP